MRARHPPWWAGSLLALALLAGCKGEPDKEALGVEEGQEVHYVSRKDRGLGSGEEPPPEPRARPIRMNLTSEPPHRSKRRRSRAEADPEHEEFVRQRAAGSIPRPADAEIGRPDGPGQDERGDGDAPRGRGRVSSGDRRRVGRAGRAVAYHSPKRLQRQELIAAAAEDDAAPKIGVRAAAEAKVDAEVALEPPALTGMQTDMPELLIADPTAVGNYRVQVSAGKDFKVLVFDKTYPFLEDFNPARDMRRDGARSGKYWVRMTVIDLLGYQQPYSEPKQYAFDGSR